MNNTERSHLLAEQKFLQERLAKIPGSARLMRMSTESRISTIAGKLALAVDEGEPAKINLTFKGRPVIGSHGVFAQFGTEAVSKFTEAVDAIAASLSAPLRAMGPIPNRGQQLLITNTAIGSFGFELQEYCTSRLPLGDSLVVLALERTQNFLESTVGTDDQLADSAAETDPRALDKMRAFLQTLADNDALVGLEFRDRTFGFSNIEQVKTSLARLSHDNIQEAEIVLHGHFDGYLPSRRTFDFILTNDELITGKAGPDIDEDALAEINLHLRESVVIKVIRTQVGAGRPRYRLLETPAW
ncbi:hypothetical protein V8G57_02570 [Collimonas sp. H4R21]|uniref:Uncharacterized protein n=1 Tax=Collimonas rhizosphaerae TaxID=3126357 RepID=A0ABU9PQH8_9BURK